MLLRLEDLPEWHAERNGCAAHGVGGSDVGEHGAGEEYDICIVGAGAAGLTLAARLAGSGQRVLLLEAGGREETEAGRDAYRGEVADPALHWPLDTYRLRALGGTSRIWGGRVIPYDAIDFEKRDWVPHSGWPIGPEALARYYPAALAAAEGGRFDFTPSGPMVPGLDGDALVTTVERFSRPTHFWRRYGTALTSARNVDVVSEAAVTAIRLTPAGDHVDHVVVHRRNGVTRRARARQYVLAMGGLETTRLLLASNDILPEGIGNAGGWLGRGYMCHLAGNFGEVRFHGDPRAIGFDYERDVDGIYTRRRLAVSAEAQRALRLMNFTARLHIPDANDPAHGNAVLSAIFLAAFAVKYEYSRAMREGDRSWPVMRAHWANIARDPLRLAHFAATWGRKRYLASRRIPSIALYARNGVYPIEFHCEQAPNPDSRVTLSDERDAFGMPRLRVDWRVTPLDLATVRGAYRLIARELERTGTGTLHFDDEAVESAVLRSGAYGGHHSGTARMAESPRDGVVDADCRVFGTDNLFLASGAVLPTSSQANPTLTILALALRLADHLTGLPAQRHAQPRESEGVERDVVIAPVTEATAHVAATGNVLPGSSHTVLVIGAAGFLGRAVVRRLVEAGFAVRAGVRDSHRDARLLPDKATPKGMPARAGGYARSSDVPSGGGNGQGAVAGPGTGGVEICPCDVLDRTSLASAMAGVGAVVNCAVGAAEDTRVIVEGTRNILAVAAAAARPHDGQSIHVVQISSVAVYDGTSTAPGGDTVTFDETASTACPQGAYGGAKREAEGMCLAAASAGLAVTIMRPALIWGAGSAPWVDRYVEPMRGRRWHALGRSGRGLANLVHVEDVAGFIAHMLRRAAPVAPVIYNVNGPEPVTWNLYLESLREGLGLPPPLPPRAFPRVALALRLVLRLAETLWRPRDTRNRASRALAELFDWAAAIPSRDEWRRFGARVVYSSAHMRNTGFVPVCDLSWGIAELMPCADMPRGAPNGAQASRPEQPHHHAGTQPSSAAAGAMADREPAQALMEIAR